MTAATLKNQAIGRPSLSDEDKAVVFGSLSMLTPKTPEYRKKRRELAVQFNYTERAIELLFDRLKTAFLEKEKGRGPDKPSALASTTSRDAGSNVPDVSEPRPDSN